MSTFASLFISLAILLISIILVFFSPRWWLCRRAVNRRTGKVIWREESHPGTILMASCTTINYLEVASLLIWRWWVIIDDHCNDISTSPYHCHHEYPHNHPHRGNFQDQEVLRTADCVNGTTLPFSLFPSPTTRFTQVHCLNNHPHMIWSWWSPQSSSADGRVPWPRGQIQAGHAGQSVRSSSGHPHAFWPGHHDLQQVTIIILSFQYYDCAII